LRKLISPVKAKLTNEEKQLMEIRDALKARH